MSRFIFALMLASVATLGAQAPVDPVGFPTDLQHFEQVRSTPPRPQDSMSGVVRLNAAAATVKTGETRSYPYGSVLVMEWWSPATGKIEKLDVMRKERGFGASYQDGQSGEWEYASYNLQGRLLTSAADAKACATCHKKAGEARDYVYVGRFAK